MYICWTRSCDFCSLQEISSLKLAKKTKGKIFKKMNHNLGQNKMEPQTAILPPPPHRQIKGEGEQICSYRKTRMVSTCF